jgi:O-antigen ligase
MLNSLRDLNPWRALAGRGSRPHLNPSQVRRVAIIAFTLLLAYNFGRQPSIAYVYFPVVLVALWVVYVNPGLGLFCLLAASLIVPFAIGTGTQSSLNVAILGVPILLGLWLVAMVWQRHIQLSSSATNLPLVGFIAAISLSFLVGYLPWNVFAQLAPVRAQVGQWAIFVLSAGAFWLAANRIGSLRWLKRMVWAFLILAALYIIGRLMGRAGNWLADLFVTRPPGSLFWVWLVALAAGQGLFNHNLSKLWRLALLVLVAATFIVSLGTADTRSWTSGWLPSLVALALLVFLRWPRASLVLAVGAVLIGVLYLPALRELLFFGNQYSLLTRGASFTIVLEIIKASPLLGVGPANYYYYTPLYPILGFYVQFNSHNQYVDIVAQTGGGRRFGRLVPAICLQHRSKWL